MNIIRTVFTDHKSGETSYGYRAYDDTGSTYSNIMLDYQLELEDTKFLLKIIDYYSDDIFNDMFSIADEIIIDDINYNIDRKKEWKLIAI